MPSKKRAVIKKMPKTAPKTAPKPRRSLRTKAKKDPDVDDTNAAGSDVSQKDGPANIFTTFSTDVKLKNGLSVVRSLGGNKYEIVSLDSVSQNTIGSIEAAELIKSVRGRRAALDIDKKQWDAAIIKCDVAVRVTKGDLFCFFALPPELRQTIYELVAFNPKGMRLRTRNKGCSKPFSALSFMLTCREVYGESHKIFLRNTFYLDHWATIELRKNTDFATKLEDIAIDWEGKRADAAVLRDIGHYTSLRVLRIRFWSGSISWPRRYWNHLFQTEQELKWFSKLCGFDQLLSLRGLETVSFEMYGNLAAQDDHLKGQIPVAQKAMEELLNRELTQPKPLSVKASRAFKAKGKEDTDDEDSDELYVPRPTKSRSRRTI